MRLIVRNTGSESSRNYGKRNGAQMPETRNASYVILKRHLWKNHESSPSSLFEKEAVKTTGGLGGFFSPII